jgi:hypothetical protein
MFMNHAIIFNNHTMMHQRPVGAYRIATILRDEGWDVEICDWTPFWNLDELKTFTEQRVTKDTKFIGFGCFFNYWSRETNEFAKWIKSKYPDVKILVGATTKPVIHSSCIDYFIYGFADDAVLAVVASIVGNTPSELKFDPMYNGIKTTKVVDANSSYPAFPKKSLMVKYEDRDYLEPQEWLGIEFARGCKFQCMFCNFPVLGVKGDYTRDASDFDWHVRDAYDRFGIENYYVADETFNDRIEKTEKFAKVVDKLPFKPFFSGFIRADLAISRGEKEWELLERLGFLGHFYGVETFNHDAGKAVGKGMHPDKMKQGLLDMKDYFLNNGNSYYRGMIALIVGLPNETKESTMQTIDWISKNWQGQSVDLTPLEIPIDEYTNKLPALAKNWQAMGYSEIEEKIWTPDSDDTGYNRGYGRTLLPWKNANMDINWARQTAHEFHSNSKCPQGINNWMLDWGTNSGLTLQETLDANAANIGSLAAASFKKRLLKYKAKKLGIDEKSISDQVPSVNWYAGIDVYDDAGNLIFKD